MGIGAWIFDNLFNLLAAAVAICSLWFTALAFRSETKTRRIANLLTVTANHREVWQEFLSNPALSRIRSASVDTSKHPITDAEIIFVTMVTHHVNSVYYTISDQLIVKVEGLRRDIAQFFALPIPRQVWEKIKVFQNDDFVAFVESCLNWK